MTRNKIAGFTLIESLITLTVLSIGGLAFSMQVLQQARQIRSLEATMAVMDLKTLLTTANNQGLSCLDNEMTSAAIDANDGVTLNQFAFYSKSTPPSPLLKIETGKPLAGASQVFRIQSITLDTKASSLKIEFTADSGFRAPQALTIPGIGVGITQSTGSPKKVSSCGGSGNGFPPGTPEGRAICQSLGGQFNWGVDPLTKVESCNIRHETKSISLPLFPVNSADTATDAKNIFKGVPYFDNLRDSTGLYPDQATADQICRHMGYFNATSFSSSSDCCGMSTIWRVDHWVTWNEGDGGDQHYITGVQCAR